MAEEDVRFPLRDAVQGTAPQTHHAGPSDSSNSNSNSNSSSCRTNIEASEKQQQEPTHQDMTNLPLRTLNNTANLSEYTQETISGYMPHSPPASDPLPRYEYELVTFKLHDAENPKNWTKAKKWWCTMCVAMTCFVVAFNSAVITADLGGVSAEFGVSEEVALLTITLFVVGFGVGPMAFAPLSEIFGRRPVYAVTLGLAVIFTIPGAVAPNIGTLLATRFLAGVAFSAPMSLVGGTLVDMWKNEERGVPMAAFSGAPFIGPGVGPLVGGYLSDAAGWRWLYWIQLILSIIVWCLITFTVPETYTPRLLADRAEKLRKETGDDRYVTEQDLDLRPFGQRLSLFLLRPFQLLFQELIVFLISVYMSVLYGLLYMFFVAYPIVYQKGKGWSASSTGLMFIPLICGVILSAACAPFVNTHYLKLSAKHNGHPPAEARLIPMMLSCWFIPIGVFIFAWTSYPDLHWAGPAFGGFSVGFGFIFLYNSANNYLVDSYQHQAASALAAKTFLRSFWGAGAVLFTNQMYDYLGNQWASSLLGFIGLACCGIPFVFYFYGARIRARSHYAYSEDEESVGEKQTA
ncbi:hypothetical protein J1614_011326 [Plenodomus biglobosus]|nr:hypothetical protein J1614_011326 [Plenodomus biglobosus]